MLATKHALNADSFADTETCKPYTMTAECPVAVVRIVRGHTIVNAQAKIRSCLNSGYLSHRSWISRCHRSHSPTRRHTRLTQHTRRSRRTYLKFQKHTRRPHLDCPTTTQEYSRTRRRQIQEVGRPPVECLVDSERQTRTVSQFGRYEHESGINRQQRTPAMDLPMRGNTTRVTTNVGWRSTTNRLRHYLPF